jgi:hypothetical protein
MNKRCWKMKWRRQARLASMQRKRDTTRRCGDVNRRRNDTWEGKERKQHQLG